MAILGSLNLLFKADTKKAQKGMKDFRKSTALTMDSVSKLKTGMIGLAAVMSGGAIMGMIKGTADAARETQLWADSLGITATRLDAMNKAAQKFGIQGDVVADSMKDLGIKIDLAAKEGGGISDLFKIAGIELEKFKGMSNDQKLFTFFDELKKLDPDTARTLMDEINDSMFQLTPIMAKGKNSFRELTKQVEKNGEVINKTDRGALANMSKSYENMTGSIQLLMDKAAVKMAPLFEKIFNFMGKGFMWMAETGEKGLKLLYESFVTAGVGIHKVMKGALNAIGLDFETWFEMVGKSLDAFTLSFRMMGKALDGNFSDIFDPTKWAQEQKKAAKKGNFAQSFAKAGSVLDQDSHVLFGKLDKTLSKLLAPTIAAPTKSEDDWYKPDSSAAAKSKMASDVGSNIRQINPNKLKLGSSGAQTMQRQQLAEQVKTSRSTMSMDQKLGRMLDMANQRWSKANSTAGIGSLGLM